MVDAARFQRDHGLEGDVEVALGDHLANGRDDVLGVDRHGVGGAGGLARHRRESGPPHRDEAAAVELGQDEAGHLDLDRQSLCGSERGAHVLEPTSRLQGVRNHFGNGRPVFDHEEVGEFHTDQLLHLAADQELGCAERKLHGAGRVEFDQHVVAAEGKSEEPVALGA